MKRNWIDRFIYSITKKPTHYVEVRNPPKTAKEKLARPQDARQMQYNRWSKRYKMYSGSYLPNDHNELRKKGWDKKKVSDNMHHIYQRKSTNQTVRHDDERIKKDGTLAPSHWHWLVWWRPYFGRKTRKRFNDAVQGYNKYIRTFPKNIIANMNGFEKKAYFTSTEEAKSAPKVEF